MLRGLVLLILLVFVIVPSSLAVTVTLESEDGSVFDGLITIITYQDEKFNVFVETGNKLTFEGEGLASFQVVSEKIYAGIGKLEEGSRILVRPTAKISGKVLDDKDNLLQDVPLKFICPAVFDIPEKTDVVGFYTLPAVGFGDCEISAIVGKKVVTKEIVVNESKHYVVNLKVEDANSSSNIWFFILAVVLLAIIVFFAMKAPYGKVTKKQKDIRRTLSKSEKLVVDQLLLKNNLTQSQLRHQTGLPKSTLHRVLTKLQDKNIIIYQEESGIKKVKLTEFFKK